MGLLLDRCVVALFLFRGQELRRTVGKRVLIYMAEMMEIARSQHVGAE
jgi:hypothetical protein